MWKRIRSVPRSRAGVIWLLGVTAASLSTSCGSSEAASFDALRLPSGEVLPLTDTEPLTATESDADLSLEVEDRANNDDSAPSEQGEPTEGEPVLPPAPGNEEEPGAEVPVASQPGDEEVGPVQTQPQPLLPPGVVSVEPPTDSTGVSANEGIVIRFSKAMNQQATEAAYQSETIPSSSVEFSWNEDSTQLTIRPLEPMRYATGSDPAEVAARRMSFFLSGAAQDREGERMGVAFESGFSLLREIRGQLQAVRDRDLSGNYRSNDTYGGGQCARDETTICFGDSGTGDEVSYRGFVTFDLAGVPQGLDGLSNAELTFDIADLEGEPFSLGGLRVEQAEFDEIGMNAFAGAAVADVAFIPDPAERDGQFTIDVTDVFAAGMGSRQQLQFRFAFEVANDLEEDFDAVVTSWDSHSLEYSFLIP